MSKINKLLSLIESVNFEMPLKKASRVYKDIESNLYKLVTDTRSSDWINRSAMIRLLTQTDAHAIDPANGEKIKQPIKEDILDRLDKMAALRDYVHVSIDKSRFK